ncbi:MAG: hypothetical protein ACRDKX_06460 [Solirubrobacterales bacterium]
MRRISRRTVRRIGRMLRAIRHPRRTYRRTVARATYLWGPKLASWFRKRWVILKNPHADIRFDKHCLLEPGFSLYIPEGGSFVAGKYVHFRRGFRCEIWKGGSVTIGELCVFSYYTLMQCATSITIGDRVMTGQSCGIFDGNHLLTDVSEPIHGQGYDLRPLTIEDDVTTLTKVTITHNIRRKAVVAANSFVNREVPAWSVVGGVPAKLLDYFGPPELEPPEWAERRRARGEPDPTPRPNRLEVSGHSLAFGGGVSAFRHRFTTRLAESLDADEENHSLGGAIACWHQTGSEPGDGGYAHVLQRVLRPPDFDRSPAPGLTCLSYYGINDLAVLGPDGLEVFEHALCTIVSRHRACAVFEESDPSVSASGGWQPRAAEGPDCSGDGVLETERPGEAVTITTPGEFAGGTVAIGFVAAPGGGAAHEISVDGEPAGRLDTRGATDSLGHRNGAVARLRGLGAGRHQIVCRVAEPAGATAFDYWQLEPDGPPHVLVPLAFPIAETRAYRTWPHEPTAAGVELLNAAIRRVAAEFDGWALPVETAPLLEGRPELFSWEGRYPTDDGHAAIARACEQALASAGALGASGQRGAQRIGVSR